MSGVRTVLAAMLAITALAAAAQAPDGSTIGVILNRPAPRRDADAQRYIGGPVMQQVTIALFTSQARAARKRGRAFSHRYPQPLAGIAGKARGSRTERRIKPDILFS